MLENKTGVFDAGHLKGWILKKGFSWLHAFRILRLWGNPSFIPEWMRQIAGGHRHPVSKASAVQITWTHLETRIVTTPTNKTQTQRPKPDKTKPKTETRQERIEDVRKRERHDLERERDDDDHDPSMVLSLKDGNEIQCICAHPFAVGLDFCCGFWLLCLPDHHRQQKKKKVAKEKTDLGGSQAQRTAFLLVGTGGRACFVFWVDLLLLLLFFVSLGFGCHGRRRKSNRRSRRRRVAAGTSTSGGARRSERSHATGSRALQAFLFSRMGVRDRRQHHSQSSQPACSSLRKTHSHGTFW
jgi:hypothetical protein